ncbi:mogroside I-E synthase-like [Tasmannia lanceolata]|uniref:mogroside I-E synthase-like n=1 Tax=Tasmannia lanceolata TaxID=3420 RepID=UPI0040638D8A
MNSEEMENKEVGNTLKAHVLILPFPGQGHINPAIQFAKRLASKGLKVTVATTIVIKLDQELVSPVSVEPICNVSEYLHGTGANFGHIQAIVVRALMGFVEKHEKSGDPFCCLIYDSVLPWCLDIAKQLGLYGAPFFTQPCAVSSIFYHVYQGRLSVPLDGPTVSLPGLPKFELSDLPTFITKSETSRASLELLVSQFCNLEKADWVFINTFEKLEAELISWMKELWPVKTIGPSVPSIYVDKLIEGDKNYGLNLWIPDGDTCMKWLDTKPTGSVVYVSLGSISTLGLEQMEELAWGLRGNNKYFLWVVRASEEKKLPSNFVEETKEKGLIVNWCPQLEVLAHEAVSCFVTHCGWNSTVEALSLGVPMVAMPQWADQPTNAKYVEDIWGVGVRARTDEKGIVRREEMELCIREAMEGEKGKVIRKNAGKWRELAIEALEVGGSSNNNIEDFVAALLTK